MCVSTAMAAKTLPLRLLWLRHRLCLVRVSTALAAKTLPAAPQVQHILDFVRKKAGMR